MKRSTNQDSIFIEKGRKIFVVADGMGGHNGGDIASAMAVDIIPKYFEQNTETEPITLTKDAILSTNQSIKQRGLTDEKLEGMGTTTVTLFFKEDKLYIGNVGDSRAYLINNKNLYQLSKDHSLVQEKLNMAILGEVGDYNRESASNDPHKNVICRTVGFEEKVDVDVFTYKVSRYDLFLICSDGLHGKVSDSDILHIVNQEIPNPANVRQEQVDSAVEKLVDQANKNGGNDNISVIIVVAK